MWSETKPREPTSEIDHRQRSENLKGRKPSSNRRHLTMARSRLEKEFAEISKDDDTSGVKAVRADGKNLRHLKGTIKGSSGTPYEGGVFVINIEIPKQYPFEPPKMKFDTKIWHPNISSQTGAICLVRLSLRGLFRIICVLQASQLSSQSAQHCSAFSLVRCSWVIRIFSRISGAQL